MVKRILLIFSFCVFISAVGNSQQYKFVYYLDENLVSVSKARAAIIGKGLYEDGRFKLDCFSLNGDKPLLTLHFTDSTLAHLEGSFNSYYANGKTEKTGNYVNDLEEGGWVTWDEAGLKKDSVLYKKGVPYVKAHFTFDTKGQLTYYSIKDSLQNTFHTIAYNDSGRVNSEVFFKGEKGTLKRYTLTGTETDSLFTRDEIEATFPGGDAGWRLYLQRNLNANVPVDNKAPAGKYTVIIKFIITKDGSLKDIYAETYHGYGMEKEVIRIIKNGPKWIPAVQYGRKVNAYRRQPVTFLVDY